MTHMAYRRDAPWRFARWLAVAVLCIVSSVAPWETRAVAEGAQSNLAATAQPLTIALLAPPQSLNPLLDADQYGTDIDRLLYRTLLTETPTLRLAPDLAQSWNVSRNGTVYTYHLGDDARWTDGRPVTAADVVWTLNAFRNPANGSPAQTQFALVRSVTAEGANTVVVRLARPWAPWNSVVASTPILPGHALAHVAGAKAIVQNPILNSRPITDGPYRLAEWQRRSGTVILKASGVDPNAPPTQIRTVIFRVIADPADAIEALKAGQVQVAPVPVAAWPRILKRANGFRVFATPELGVSFIGFNLEDPIFQSALVRRALNLAVNREAILRVAYHDLGEVPNGPLPPASWAYDAKLPPLPYDPALARQLLRQAGYRPGPGGVLVKGHMRMQFGLAYARGTPELSTAVVMVAKDLRKVGVAVTLVPMQFGALNGLAQAGEFDAIAEGWSYGPDPDLTAILGGTASFPPKGLDVTRYQDATVTRLLAAETASLSEKRRKALFAELTKVLEADPPYIPLVAGESLTAVSDRLVGYVSNPAGPDFYEVQDWRWLTLPQHLN